MKQRFKRLKSLLKLVCIPIGVCSFAFFSLKMATNDQYGSTVEDVMNHAVNNQGYQDSKKAKQQDGEIILYNGSGEQKKQETSHSEKSINKQD